MIEIESWRLVIKTLQRRCGPAVFICVPTRLQDLFFICEKLIFEKEIWSHLLFLFISKEIKSQVTHFLRKNVSTKIESKFRG